ncbi:MAG: prepilin-type N-terminal cleavage/methylation domain-containing protein [Planctomycetes bacterium]|nr:prepilin-type N-terminal cleavage/methylation domain-containing protein [Planctomycetota bacterium]
MRRPNAFTLTELLVALGLGAIILMVVTMSLNTATRAINRTTSQVNLHSRGYATMSRMMNELESINPCLNNNHDRNPDGDNIDAEHRWLIRYTGGNDAPGEREVKFIFLTSRTGTDTEYDGDPPSDEEPPHDLVWVRYLWNWDTTDATGGDYNGKDGYLMRKEVTAFDPELEGSQANLDSYLDNPASLYTFDINSTEYIFDRKITAFEVLFNNETQARDFNWDDDNDGWPEKITVRYTLEDPRTETEKEFSFTVRIPGYDQNPETNQ